MSHVPVLIQDLAVILFAAGLITLLFKWLKQPVVLGYIVAGFIAGPYFMGDTWIGDAANIRIWGEIGVIFLLFALGLEFSFRKLLNVGATAIIGASTIVLGMMTSGYLTGKLIGWSDMNSLFLGGMLSMSSTTIVYKALDDMGLRKQRFARVVFGVLIVEDLLAILLMVLLSTIAMHNSIEGMTIMESILRLAAYLLFWFVGGIYLIPSFLKSAKRYLNDETQLVVALGLCLGMVMLADKAGFSAALGAFVMGSILAETVEAENIERLILPVKDLFGAIFFVSVGMMIDPEMLVTYWMPITAITMVVVFGQLIFASTGILLSGQPLKIALQSGFSLAQIGEFAFIIASLGLSLNVTAPFLYPIVVAVSVITTFLTPYLVKASDPVYMRLEKSLPLSTRKFLERYSSGANTMSHQSTWNKLMKALLRIVLVYGGLAAFLIFIYFSYFSPLLLEYLPGMKGRVLSLLIILSILAPLLRAIMMKKNHSREFTKLWQDNRFNRGFLVTLVVTRILLCLGFVMFICIQLFSIALGFIFAISGVVITFFIFSRRVKMHSIKLERRFLKNLSARQDASDRLAPFRQRFVRTLLSRDLHLADLEVAPDSPNVGKRLRDLRIREDKGVNIVKIIRGGHHINIPGGNDRLFPFDKIVVAGTDTQIETFSKFVEESGAGKGYKEDIQHEEVTIEQFVVDKTSFFNGCTIAHSHIRDKAHCLVIGIERGNSSLLNPDPSVSFQEGDVVWVAGEKSKMEELLTELSRHR